MRIRPLDDEQLRSAKELYMAGVPPAQVLRQLPKKCTRERMVLKVGPLHILTYLKRRVVPGPGSIRERLSKGFRDGTAKL
jgi:hypothetical protein